MTRLVSLCAVGAAMIAVPVRAGSITISSIGGGITLNSGDLSSTVFGSVKPAWGVGSLSSVDTALNAAGIDTEGHITFVAADTNHGLALLVLIDRELGAAPPGQTGRVEMTSVGVGPGVQYINNIASTVHVVSNSGGVTTASASFQWNSNGGGDAFAWANLQANDAVSFRFGRPSTGMGLLDDSTFQFVSWNGAGWEQVSVPSGQSLFDSDGTYGFSGRVAVPLPSALALSALPLMALSAMRRRRSR